MKGLDFIILECKDILFTGQICFLMMPQRGIEAWQRVVRTSGWESEDWGIESQHLQANFDPGSSQHHSQPTRVFYRNIHKAYFKRIKKKLD